MELTLILIILFLALIAFVCLGYIGARKLIKTTKKQDGAGLFSKKPKVAASASKTAAAASAATAATTPSRRRAFLDKQKERWNDPNSMRRQLAQQAVNTGAAVAVNQIAPGLVDPNMQIQQLQGMVQTGVNGVLQPALTTINGMTYQVIPATQQLVNGVMQTIPQQLVPIQNAAQGVVQGVQGVIPAAQGVVQGVAQGVQGVVPTVQTAAQGIVQGVTQPIVQGVQGVVPTTQTIAQPISTAVKRE